MSFRPPPPGLAGLRLASLSAVAFDTETTGLDTARDRIVEIGAVRLTGGRVDEDDARSWLIDPGVPIPPAATAIHTLTDAAVAGAPPFGAVMETFAEWAGPAVLVGHSLGFDLAVLEAEHARHARPWRPPRTLDIRDLVEALGPELPDRALETLAGWLGVPVERRHRALADATLAARLFVALLPRLREAGVSTVAEAERACRAVRSRSPRIGGAEPAAPAPAEYLRIDSFPYRHRVGEVMSAPPAVAAPDLTLAAALARMIRERVGSLVVAGDGGYGILTERDALRAVQAGGAGALGAGIDRFCSRPLKTVAETEFVYRALVTMKMQGFRHLGVVDAAGRVVGALSARDLLRQRAEDAVSLGHEIETAETPAELGRVWSELAVVARALAGERVGARLVAAIVSRELRALTGRACEIAGSELAAAGEGPAPQPWAMLILGSGGRGESLLAMDQDNAIVYREGGPGSAADRWCEALGRRAAAILDEVGVRYCKGGVMAANAAWRHDLAGWRRTVGDWLARTRPEDILNADIFFDAAAVHGDAGLADRLCAEARIAARAARPFLHALARGAARFDDRRGWFGRLRLERGRIDLKKAGVMPVFSAARVVALRHGIADRSTAGRLRAARDAGHAPGHLVDDLLAAHEILLDLVLRQQLRDLDRGVPLSNRVAPADLDGLDRQRLDWALARLAGVSDLLGVPAAA